MCSLRPHSPLSFRTAIPALPLLLLFFLICAPAFPQTAASSGFHADLSFYLLGAGMSGETTVRGFSADVDVPFSQIWKNLQFGAMGRSTFRYNRWALSTDLIYVGLGAVKNDIDVGFDQWLVQPAVEYELTPWLSPYAGARGLRLTGEIRGPRGNSGSSTQVWWDPIVGAEVRLPATGKFRLRLRGDLGGFGAGSRISGQIEPVLDWRVSRRLSLQAGYRWLYADYESGSGRETFRYDLVTQGPQFGATFRF